MIDEVMFDLLPLYRSGQASEASCHLVESWLAENPGFRSPTDRVDPVGAETDAAERRALARARRFLKWRRRSYGFAMALTAILFATALNVQGGHIVAANLLMFELPQVFAPIGVAAALCWIVFWRLGEDIR